MKFFINEVEVTEVEFQDKFLNMRLLEEEKHDLSLIYIRALSEMLITEEEKKTAFMRMISGYEVRRCFRDGRFVTVLGQLFEIREEPAPVESAAQ